MLSRHRPENHHLPQRRRRQQRRDQKNFRAEQRSEQAITWSARSASKWFSRFRRGQNVRRQGGLRRNGGRRGERKKKQKRRRRGNKRERTVRTGGASQRFLGWKKSKSPRFQRSCRVKFLQAFQSPGTSATTRSAKIKRSSSAHTAGTRFIVLLAVSSRTIKPISRAVPRDQEHRRRLLSQFLSQGAENSTSRLLLISLPVPLRFVSSDYIFPLMFFFSSKQ